MKFNKVFCINKNLNHTFKKSSIIKEVNSIDENTIVFLNVKDKNLLIKIPTKFHTNVIFYNKDDIINLSFNSLKDTLLYRNNERIRKMDKTIISNHSIDLKLIDSILENSNESVNNKFHYTLIKGILKKLSHLDLVKNDNKMNAEMYYKILNIITGNCYNKTRFESEISKFSSSSFVKYYNKTIITLQPNNELLDNHSLYSGLIVYKDTTDRNKKEISKFNNSIFLNKCVQFSYGKPLIQNSQSNMKSTISQKEIGEMYNISQSQVSMLTKGLTKLYKYQLVTENEYNEYKFQEMTDNLEDNDNGYVFKLKTSLDYVDTNTGEIFKKTLYFKTLGSKLLSKFKYSSIIKKDKRTIKLKKLVNSNKQSVDAKGRIESDFKNNKLETVKHEKINITQNNDLVKLITYYNQLQQNNDINIAKPNQFQVSKELKYNKNLQIQFIGNAYSVVKSKLQMFTNTFAMVELLSNHISCTSFNLTRSLKKQYKDINYKFYKLKQYNKDLANSNFLTYNIFRNAFKAMTEFINSNSSFIKDFQDKLLAKKVLKLNSNIIVDKSVIPF